MIQTEKGIVIASRGRSFEVRVSDGSRLLCEVRRKVKDEADNVSPVAVGDDVELSRTNDREGAIEKVLERRTAFFKPTVGLNQIKQVITTNLDQLAAVVSVASPPLKTGLIDRFVIAAQLGKMKPVLIINKIDLEKPPDFDCIMFAYRNIGVGVVATSIVSGHGLSELKELLCGHRTLFAGHSGVGKSSLLNSLIPELELKTNKVSDYSNRGKHTTTAIEMYELPTGGFVVDSPGLKVMGLWEVEKGDVAYYYVEFGRYSSKCRFSTCSHVHEPNCAVKEAVEKGEIARFRYDNYLAIVESV